MSKSGSAKKPEFSGVAIIDKPIGPTSHDMVARVRRRLGQRSVGHAGTLDPFASGVLVVAMGQGTKLVPYLTAAEKTYSATLMLGATTATFDPTEPISLRAPLPADLAAELADGGGSVRLSAAMDIERGRTQQTPPMHSAIHVDGVRAYSLARQGVQVDLPPREVAVRELSVESCTLHTDRETASLTLRLTVTKGYYVRALARDLAQSLGTVGHLTALRRTAAAPFTIAEASSIEELRVHTLADVARRILPAVRLTERGVIDGRIGRTLDEADYGPQVDGPTAWFSPDGELIAIGEGGRVLRGFTSSSQES